MTTMGLQAEEVGLPIRVTRVQLIAQQSPEPDNFSSGPISTFQISQMLDLDCLSVGLHPKL